MMTVDHVEVGISKRPDGSRNIAIAFHDPELGVRLHPLTIQEAHRLRDALARAIEIMGAS